MLTPDFTPQDDFLRSKETSSEASGEPPRLPPVKPATLRLDTTFEFLSGGQIIEMDGERIVAQQHFSRRGHCRLRVFDLAEGGNVVIATDLDEENNGPGVTNAAEDIASQACLRYDLDPAHTLFVEHYDDRFRGVWHGQLVEAKRGSFGRENGESFDWVSFPQRQGMTFGEPVWKHASKSQVEALLGQRLP